MLALNEEGVGAGQNGRNQIGSGFRLSRRNDKTPGRGDGEEGRTGLPQPLRGFAMTNADSGFPRSTPGNDISGAYGLPKSTNLRFLTVL